MDHELWAELSHGMFDVARGFPRSPRQTYSTHAIVRVYLWAVLHDRPVDWATRPGSWPRPNRPASLPDQSTMSRRLREPATTVFLEKLARRMAGPMPERWLKLLDGKPLTVPRHSSDPDATSGRGVGGMAKGYKLHAIWADGPMPVAWSVQPLNVAEQVEALTLADQLTGEGYLLADANYDSNPLYERLAAHGHQMIAPRRRPGTGWGTHPIGAARLRSIHLLELNPSPFAREIYRCRGEIERSFSGLVCFGGGLQCLPPWVRTLRRVRLFVHAKLIINATRIRRLAA